MMDQHFQSIRNEHSIQAAMSKPEIFCQVMIAIQRENLKIIAICTDYNSFFFYIKKGQLSTWFAIRFQTLSVMFSHWLKFQIESH